MAAKFYYGPEQNKLTIAINSREKTLISKDNFSNIAHNVINTLKLIQKWYWDKFFIRIEFNKKNLPDFFLSFLANFV